MTLNTSQAVYLNGCLFKKAQIENCSCKIARVNPTYERPLHLRNLKRSGLENRSWKIVRVNQRRIICQAVNRRSSI